MKAFGKGILLFLVGGLIYFWLEVLWRGYSHWSMFLLGGLCFVLCGLINEVVSWDMPLLLQMLISALMITALEFLTGCIVNLWLGWQVWDYSKLRFQLLGQISLQSSVIWFLLSSVGIVLDDWIRYWFFGEEKPYYRLR
ncbi:putative ABC transporter permease [Faecalispora anaeroviscerum]|uniref:putative ABC transporter permease n=1 Tax=Faecalispora anaeroviscerum TaxID=2991836 RepID=UPI0024BA5CDD|nr:hypothetical protein [Faecalispora anaeroviscerum]